MIKNTDFTWFRRAPLFLFCVLLASLCLLNAVGAIESAVNAYDNCPSAAYVVKVNATVAPRGVNVRLGPPVGGTLQPVIGSMSIGDIEEAREVRDGWYLLCAGGYVSGTVVLATAYTATAVTTTPTRIPTETPTPLSAGVRFSWDADIPPDGTRESLIEVPYSNSWKLESISR
jgi:hypothetical protein